MARLNSVTCWTSRFAIASASRGRVKQTVTGVDHGVELVHSEPVFLRALRTTLYVT